MSISQDYLDFLKKCLKRLDAFGNQEFGWISQSFSSPETPSEFRQYIDRLSSEGLPISDYGIGSDLIQNFLEQSVAGLDPYDGWRYRLELARKDVPASYECPRSQYYSIWEGIAYTDAHDLLPEKILDLKKFCKSVGGWQMVSEDRYECRITY